MGDTPERMPAADQPGWRLAIRNDLAAVGSADRSLEEFLQGSSVDSEAVYSPVLALEEVLTNIIKYGYDDDREHEIVIEARLLPGGLVIQVTDDGHEFDPLQAPPPDLDLPFEERPIGGLGLRLLKNIAEQLSYERVGDHNVLTLRFAV